MQEDLNRPVPVSCSAPPTAGEISARVASAIACIDGRSIPDSLLRQVLLHAHRFNSSELSTPAVLEQEVRRIENRLAAGMDEVPSALRDPAQVELQGTHLDVVDTKTAELVHRTYHYLGSPRENGMHLGLYANKGSGDPKLMTLVTLSEFDLPHMVNALPLALRGEQVLVISRLFSFSWCPRNAMSHTLGLTFSWIRKHRPEVRMILTYLDPNLGFRGTIYQATNWILFGRENKKRYLYLDGDYVTDRRMIKDYGTADPRKLARLLGSRVTTSVAPLRPLEIYAYFLAQRDRAKYNQGTIKELTPPTGLVGG